MGEQRRILMIFSGPRSSVVARSLVKKLGTEVIEWNNVFAETAGNTTQKLSALSHRATKFASSSPHGTAVLTQPPSLTRSQRYGFYAEIPKSFEVWNVVLNKPGTAAGDNDGPVKWVCIDDVEEEDVDEVVMEVRERVFAR